MRTWVNLAGVLFILYGAMRWLSSAYFQFGEAPTTSIASVAVGVVLVLVANFVIKETKAGA